MRVLWFLLVLPFSTASAERYTVQVAAFRHDAPAFALIAALQREGFAAYREATQQGGQSLHRVRVGCFGDTSSAKALVALLPPSARSSATVVRLGRAPELPCLLRELGFLLPASPGGWGVAAQDALTVVFWVRIGQERGYIAFDDRGWRVLQADTFASTQAAAQTATATPPRAAGSSLRVGSQTLHGADAVVIDGRVTAAGRLLWHSAETVIVDDGDAVVALRLEGAR